MSAETLFSNTPYITSGAVLWMTTLNPAVAAGTGLGYAGWAMQMELIRQGKTTEYSLLGAVWEGLKAFPKEFNVGALTIGAGGAAGVAALARGASAPVAGAARMAAEGVTMPFAGALQELRWPHAQEFVDAFVFVVALNAGRGANLARDIATAVPEGDQGSPAFTSETAEGMSRLADVENTIGAGAAEVKPQTQHKQSSPKPTTPLSKRSRDERY